MRTTWQRPALQGRRTAHRDRRATAYAAVITAAHRDAVDTTVLESQPARGVGCLTDKFGINWMVNIDKA
jgi:uncharacterized glyoxalase superfamily protein PhnB